MTTMQALEAQAINERFARMTPWGRLGTGVEGAVTAHEALDRAGLEGWNVRKLPLQTWDENGHEVKIADQFASARTDPRTGQTHHLGVVGNRYQAIQNEEHIAFLDSLLDMSGAHFTSAGFWDGGRRTFATMKMPEGVTVGGTGGDRIDTFIHAINSHDGTTGFRLVVSPLRLACTNQIQMMLRTSPQAISIRHTHSAAAAMDQARHALKITYDFLAEFDAEAERMVQTQLTADAFEAIIEAEYGPKPESDPSKSRVTRWEKKRDDLMGLFCSAETQNPIRDTRWAGFQAITEWEDYFRGVHGEDKATARAEKAMSELGQAHGKQRAFEMFRVPVGV